MPRTLEPLCLQPEGNGPPAPHASRPRPRSSAAARLALAVAASAAIGFGAVLTTDLPVASGIASKLWQSPDRTVTAREDAAAVYLVRSTLMALDDANRTGNYTVLRDLASPSFQAANSAQRLGEIFAPHRQAQLDLSIAASSEPRWLSPPSVGADRLLRLIGRLDRSSGSIDFALAFEPQAGAWRLYEIHVLAAPPKRRDD